jgi:membrane carboxypeptidase/penicillin-binding protein
MDRPQPIFKLNRGRQATGGGLAAPVWGRFMKQVYYGSEAQDGSAPTIQPALPIPPGWAMPSGLKSAMVDKKTGKLASRWCAAEDAYLEYFVPGTEPTEFCDNSGGRRLGIPRQDP